MRGSILLLLEIECDTSGRQGPSVCTKPTHVDLSSHKVCNPSQKHARLTHIQWAKTICNDSILDTEIGHLKTFKCNGYSNYEVASAPKQRSQTYNEVAGIG